MQIQTYSSKTGKWTSSTLISTENFSLNVLGFLFMEPFVSNGVFHWPTWSHSLAVYDSNEDEN